MKRALVLLALCALGCGAGSMRLPLAIARGVCGVLGCTCNAEAARRGIVAVDVLPDGGVVPVYAEPPR